MSNFHDEDYEGIVIKVPSMFRDKEKAQKSISKIKKIIEEEIQPNTFVSGFHPDWRKTYSELEDWNEKKQIIREQEERLKERRERAEKLKRRIRTYKDFPLEWNTYREEIFVENIELAGQTFDWDDIFNLKSIKKSFKDFVANTTKEQRLEFFEDSYQFPKYSITNKHFTKNDCVRVPDDMFYYSRTNSEYELAYKFERLEVRLFSHSTGRNEYFHYYPLYFDPEKELYFIDFEARDVPDALKDDIIEVTSPVGLNANRTFKGKLYYFDNHEVRIVNQKIVSNE